MSLVDTRYPELDLFLQGWQARLNRRFLWGEALAAASMASVVAGVAAAFSGPNGGIRLAVWAGLTLAATAGFLAWRWRRRLNRAEAAAWLDEFGNTQGLFRAASECLDREGGPLEQAVLTEADRRRAPPWERPRLPWRRLALRFLGAAGSVALALGALLLVVPPAGYGPLSVETSSPTARGPQNTEAPDQESTQQLSPHEAAKRLFPEDQRLAALAEQALASGDPGALEALLQQNSEATGRGRPAPSEPSPGAAPGKGGSAQQDSTPGEGTQRPGTSQDRPQDQNSDPSSGSDNPGAQDGKGGGQPGNQAPQSLAQGEDNDDPATSEGRAEAGPQGMSGGGSGLPLSSGGAPGTGHSQQRLGTPQTGSSDRKLALKDKENPGVFEYVLPGAEAQLPSAEVLADSRRSAEAVISRTSPPLEFENTIRDYFLSLSTLANSQEVSP